MYSRARHPSRATSHRATSRLALGSQDFRGRGGLCPQRPRNNSGRRPLPLFTTLHTRRPLRLTLNTSAGDTRSNAATSASACRTRFSSNSRWRPGASLLSPFLAIPCSLPRASPAPGLKTEGSEISAGGDSGACRQSARPRVRLGVRTAGGKTCVCVRHCLLFVAFLCSCCCVCLCCLRLPLCLCAGDDCSRDRARMKQAHDLGKPLGGVWGERQRYNRESHYSAFPLHNASI